MCARILFRSRRCHFLDERNVGPHLRMLMTAEATFHMRQSASLASKLATPDTFDREMI